MSATPMYASLAKNIAVRSSPDIIMNAMLKSQMETLPVSDRKARLGAEARSRAITATPRMKMDAATRNSGTAGRAGSRVIPAGACIQYPYRSERGRDADHVSWMCEIALDPRRYHSRVGDGLHRQHGHQRCVARAAK